MQRNILSVINNYWKDISLHVWLKITCRKGDSICVIDASCYLCEENQETVNHFFLHCRISRQWWELFLTICGISWVMPQTVRSLLEEWQVQNVPRKLKRIWRTIPLCILWSLWLERNNACINGHRNRISRIKNKCIHNLYYWCNGGSLMDLYQFMDFLDSLSGM